MPGTLHDGVNAAVQIVGQPVSSGTGYENGQDDKKQSWRQVSTTGYDSGTQTDEGQ